MSNWRLLYGYTDLFSYLQIVGLLYTGWPFWTGHHDYLVNYAIDGTVTMGETSIYFYLKLKTLYLM